jgi:HSP20 family protein
MQSRNPWTDLDEYFNDALENFRAEYAGSARRFAIDVEEDDAKYTIEADLPGIEKDCVRVTLHDRMLTIQVRDEGRSEKKEKNYVCKERWEGSASRTVTLPLATDEKDIEAGLRNGILKIEVKKHPESRTKKIDIH